jgi:hypothetical protein
MNYLGKGGMLTNSDLNICAHNLREISFLCIWEISGIFYFQLMKYETNTLHVAFIFLFRVVTANINCTYSRNITSFWYWSMLVPNEQVITCYYCDYKALLPDQSGEGV